MEKGEKYHIEECYLVGKPANRLPFRGQEKSRNNECLNVCCALSLSHCFKVTIVLKINLAPFLQEEALSDNVMRNKMLINVGVLKGHYNKTTN